MSTTTTARTFGPDVLASCPALDLELRTDTQTATAYLGGRPVATVSRGRIYSLDVAWAAYDLTGARICDAPTALAMVARLRRYFLSHVVTTTCTASGRTERAAHYSRGEAAEALICGVLAACEAQGMRDTRAAWIAYGAARRAGRDIRRGDVSGASIQVGAYVVAFQAGRV